MRRIAAVAISFTIVLPSLGSARPPPESSLGCPAYRHALAEARAQLARGGRERALAHLRVARQALAACEAARPSEEVSVALVRGG